jgi:hypothetical protein
MERPSLEIEKGNKSTHELQNKQTLTTKDGGGHLSWPKEADVTPACRSLLHQTGFDRYLIGFGPWQTGFAPLHRAWMTAIGMKTTTGLKETD